MYECLELLTGKGYEPVQICTMPDDGYDKTERIQAYAREHGIPCDTEKLTQQKMAYFESIGVELMVIAGYAWKIPLSEQIRQVNIHPAYLPVGRGSWPMPVAILKETDSGVTLHKLSERFDEGDILLQERIGIAEQDNLVTLMDKIRVTAAELLGRFLECPEKFWENAEPQGKGEYWKEPTEEERTFSLTEKREKISRILRAFYGYGCLSMAAGFPIEIVRGRVVTEPVPVQGKEALLKLTDGFLYCEEWRPAFRKIRLEDKDRIERIRGKYQPELSDYTFALLYCWQEELQLSVYVEEDFYAVKGRDFFFFPVGSAERIRQYIDGLLGLGIHPEFRFCDRKMLAIVEQSYRNRYRASEARDDSDYVVSNAVIKELPGSVFAKRRNAFAHYSKLQPAPEVELITQENAKCLKEISELFSGADKCAEKVAIEHFFDLDMIGIIVRRGDGYEGFSLCSQKDEKTLQGHFMKCISPERGSKFYLMKSCIDAFSDRYTHTNMEDDMGEEGLRKFKSSFEAELVSAYTIQF